MTEALQTDPAARLAATLGPDDEQAFTTYALRSRSPLARAAVSRLAADGDPLWSHALARITALDTSDDEAWRRGLAQYDQLRARRPLGTWPRASATLFAQLLLRTGRVDELAELLPDLDVEPTDLWGLRVDLANPFLRAEEPTSQAVGHWLSVFAEVFDDEVEPVTLLPGPAESPYQRLASPAAGTRGGDLVTVVMSAHDPTPDLLTAVRSVLDQTWQDLELLVVDDASTSGGDLLDEAAALDPRVRVLRAPSNAGTYAARNLALEHARGRYVTFQDSDDWTHPRRIEVQVQAVQDDPHLLASRTWTLRAFPDLSVTYVGYPPHRLNASSLLFERRPVVDLIGGFDLTRKSGDMEFPLRLNAVRPRSVRDLTHPFPMAITQLRQQSLSRTDAVPGWTRWDRLAYREAYLEWHSRIRTGRADPRVTATSPRPFVLPRPSWQPVRGVDEPWSCEVAVMADLRHDHPRSTLALALAETAAAQGVRTSLVHQETPRPPARGRPRMLPEVQHAVSTGALGWVSTSEPGHASTLLVADATTLLHTTPRCSASRVLVHLVTASDPATEISDADVLAADSAALGWAGSVCWVGADPAARARLSDLLGQDRVHPVPAPPAVAVPEPLPRGPRPEGTPAVLGHHLPDRGAFWPASRQDVEAAYPVGPDHDLRFLAGCATGTRRSRRSLPPPGWLSLAGTGMTRAEFLSHLDVFVYQGPWNLSAEIAALQALAAGRPAVLPLEAEPALGGAAVFAAPSALPDELTRLLADEERVASLVRAGRRLLRGRASTWGNLMTDVGEDAPLPRRGAEQ